MEERHVPLSTVAGRLGVSERTVRRWIKAGKLRATRPGRDYRIPESALRELIEEGEVSPKESGRSSPEPSLFNGLEDERRAEATGHSAEERIGISNSLATAIENLNAGYRGALEELAGGAPDEIFALFMQASLSYVGASTIAEDAGYSVDADGDSPAERGAKQKMRDALALLEEASDEIERTMTAAEAEEELPEGVALLARYQR